MKEKKYLSRDGENNDTIYLIKGISCQTYVLSDFIKKSLSKQLVYGKISVPYLSLQSNPTKKGKKNCSGAVNETCRDVNRQRQLVRRAIFVQYAPEV